MTLAALSLEVKRFLVACGEDEDSIAPKIVELENYITAGPRDPFESFCSDVFPELVMIAAARFRSMPMGMERNDTMRVSHTVSTQERQTLSQAERTRVFERVAAKILVRNGENADHGIDFGQCRNTSAAVNAFISAYSDIAHDEDALMVEFSTAVMEFKTKKYAPPPSRTEEPSDDVANAFQSKYIGDTNEKLYTFLDQCWTAYLTHPKIYRYPYVAMVQSSGFGKTRLLRELAVHFASDAQANAVGLHRLVYVNVRPCGSTGFPRRTDALATHFFTTRKETTDAMVKELANKLVHLFTCVMSDASIQDKLLDLFTGKDKPFTDELESTTFPRNRPESLTTKTRRRQVLVFAVDEASALVPRTPQDDTSEQDVDWFCILRRALQTANAVIRSQHPDQFNCGSGILALLVDADASIATWVPPPLPPPMMDPSARKLVQKKMALFRPFVLTHTMDVIHHTALVSSLSSDSENRSSSWKHLRTLGRPLWLRLEDPLTRERRDDVIQAAAMALLGGVWTLVRASLNDQTLHGVAALLCRVGIRPHASATALATRLVKHGMAVLSYIASDRKTMVVSYASDPILTLGATLLWHMEGGCGSILADAMLPQLRKLVRQEMVVVVDGSGSGGSHGIDMVVARIVLLLAMDACDLIERGPSETDYWRGAGEFVSVWTFLRALQGDDVAVQQRQVVDGDDGEDGDAVASLLTASVASCWSKWKVSFTHFVELDDLPSQASLWAMLGRRAAGIVPRRGLPKADDQRSSTVDLVIPICTIEEDGGDQQQQQVNLENPTVRVSMIVVQVRSVTQIHEQQWVDAALFPDPVLRICMSPCSHQVQRFYVEVPASDGQSSSSSSSYVLCLEGLGPLSVRTTTTPVSTTAPSTTPSTAAATTVDVLTPAVVEQLQKLWVPSWGTMRTLVEQDLESQETEMEKPRAETPMRWSEVEKSELLRVVSKTTAEGLLLQGNGTDGDDQQQQQQSRCFSVDSVDSPDNTPTIGVDRKRSKAGADDEGVAVAISSERGGDDEEDVDMTEFTEQGQDQSAKRGPRVKKTKTS